MGGYPVSEQREAIVAYFEEPIFYGEEGESFVQVKGMKVFVESRLEGLRIQWASSEGAEKERILGLIREERIRLKVEELKKERENRVVES